MKQKTGFIQTILLSAYLVPVVFMIQSCGQKGIPRDLIGEWRTNKSLITVRVKEKDTGFLFTSDSAIVTLNINEDKSVNGFIGSARIENGKIKTNWLLPVKMSGLSFTIKSGRIGKIFDKDPLPLKKVELWFSPGPANGKIKGDLRYTQGVNYFPMAELIFIRER